MQLHPWLQRGSATAITRKTVMVVGNTLLNVRVIWISFLAGGSAGVGWGGDDRDGDIWAGGKCGDGVQLVLTNESSSGSSSLYRPITKHCERKQTKNVTMSIFIFYDNYFKMYQLRMYEQWKEKTEFLHY